GSLSGNGNFYMHTNVAAGQGDRLVVTGTAEGSHRVYVADTGVSPKAGTDLTLTGLTAGVDARHERGSSMTTRGVFFSYSHSDVGFDRGGKGNVDSYGAGAY
ncbi:autotransporter outer membrane beta-barrel domain-containing protein, partial [Escherichia coli]